MITNTNIEHAWQTIWMLSFSNISFLSSTWWDVMLVQFPLICLLLVFVTDRRTENYRGQGHGWRTNYQTERRIHRHLTFYSRILALFWLCISTILTLQSTLKHCREVLLHLNKTESLLSRDKSCRGWKVEKVFMLTVNHGLLSIQVESQSRLKVDLSWKVKVNLSWMWKWESVIFNVVDDLMTEKSFSPLTHCKRLWPRVDILLRFCTM